MSKEAIAIKALEALARLGNGEQYGNSTGNVIARTALFEMAEQPAPAAQGEPSRYQELREVLENLMSWQVKNVNKWHNGAYDQASKALKRHDITAQAQPAPASASSLGSLKLSMEHSAWEGVIQLSDALKNINEWAAEQPAPAAPVQEPLGCEWTPCMKLPVVVHVRKQRLGEAHVSTREGITPVHPDDLIMRGVSGEEYPIGRAIFEQTYTLDTSPQAPKENT